MRKLMLLLGTPLAIPTACLAASAPSDEVLFIAASPQGVPAGSHSWRGWGFDAYVVGRRR